MVEKKRPWEQYNEKKEEEISKEKLIEVIERVAEKNYMVGACLAIVFLTNSRICEVTRYSYDWVENAKKDSLGRIVPLTYDARKRELELGNMKLIERSPIRWKDIWVDTYEDGDWLHINTRVEKGKNPLKVRWKEAIIPLSENYYLYRLVKMVEIYLEQIGWFKFEKGYVEAAGEKRNTSETPLFTFSDEFVRKKLTDTSGLTPHVLRNIRSKFLVLYEGFSVEDLMTWTGWVSPELAIQYSKSSQSVIKMRMRESLKT